VVDQVGVENASAVPTELGSGKGPTMSWDEITILVDRAKLGDREAYGELVTRFQSSVYAMALARVRDPIEAQELAQEVFVHAMRKLPQLRDARCFAGWLRRMTARMAINRLTRRGPLFGTEPEILDGVPGDCQTPDEVMELNEAKAGLHAGLKKLKPLDRETLEAFYLRNQSLLEMADEFGTPVGTIKRRLHVARARLKDVLEGREPGEGEASRQLEVKLKAKKKRELAFA
jgi:RNA polymerase sigma-70 factor, ECF subfamily